MILGNFRHFLLATNFIRQENIVNLASSRKENCFFRVLLTESPHERHRPSDRQLDLWHWSPFPLLLGHLHTVGLPDGHQPHLLASCE